MVAAATGATDAAGCKAPEAAATEAAAAVLTLELSELRVLAASAGGSAAGAQLGAELGPGPGSSMAAG